MKKELTVVERCKAAARLMQIAKGYDEEALDLSCLDPRKDEFADWSYSLRLAAREMMKNG